MNLPSQRDEQRADLQAVLSLTTRLLGFATVVVGIAAVVLRDASWLASGVLLGLLFFMTWLVQAVDGGREP